MESSIGVFTFIEKYFFISISDSITQTHITNDRQGLSVYESSDIFNIKVFMNESISSAALILTQNNPTTRHSFQ